METNRHGGAATASPRSAESGLLGLLDTPLRTLVGLVVCPAGVVVYGSLAIFEGLRGAPPARVHRLYVAFARLCRRVAATRLEVRGRESIRPGRAFVIVSNHQSAWDPVVLVAGLPELLIRFVVKRQLMKIPIFGRALRATGNVEVVRTQTAGDVSRINEGMSRRHPDVSMLFFAEGTRSRDGALGPFKVGAFATALAHELPVLPVGLAGTLDVWPKGTLQLKRTAVAIEVGEPIEVEGLTLEDRAALRDRAREAVADLCARARERLAVRSVSEGP